MATSPPFLCIPRIPRQIGQQVRHCLRNHATYALATPTQSQGATRLFSPHVRQALRQSPGLQCILPLLKAQWQHLPYTHWIWHIQQVFLPCIQGRPTPFPVEFACSMELLHWAVQLHHLLPGEADWRTAAILLGDFFYARALCAVASAENPRPQWQCLAHTGQELAQHELAALAQDKRHRSRHSSLQASLLILLKHAFFFFWKMEQFGPQNAWLASLPYWLYILPFPVNLTKRELAFHTPWGYTRELATADDETYDDWFEGLSQQLRSLGDIPAAQSAQQWLQHYKTA